jgi:hypothetical protein
MPVGASAGPRGTSPRPPDVLHNIHYAKCSLAVLSCSGCGSSLSPVLGTQHLSAADKLLISPLHQGHPGKVIIGLCPTVIRACGTAPMLDSACRPAPCAADYAKFDWECLHRTVLAAGVVGRAIASDCDTDWQPSFGLCALLCQARAGRVLVGGSRCHKSIPSGGPLPRAPGHLPPAKHRPPAPLSCLWRRAAWKGRASPTARR